jgi:hypothetical protein
MRISTVAYGQTDAGAARALADDTDAFRHAASMTMRSRATSTCVFALG